MLIHSELAQVAGPTRKGELGFAHEFFLRERIDPELFVTGFFHQ